MKATLSYTYVGDRYPDLSGKTVVVKAIAEIAGIPYQLLKNRMGMKRLRANRLRSCFIEDKDLDPKKRNKESNKSSSLTKRKDKNSLSTEWLKRPLI